MGVRRALIASRRSIYALSCAQDFCFKGKELELQAGSRPWHAFRGLRVLFRVEQFGLTRGGISENKASFPGFLVMIEGCDQPAAAGTVQADFESRLACVEGEMPGRFVEYQTFPCRNQ